MQNFEPILNHYFIHVRTIRILLTNVSSIEEEILSYYNDNIMAVITVQMALGTTGPVRFPALAPVRITAPCTVTLQPVFPKR